MAAHIAAWHCRPAVSPLACLQVFLSDAMIDDKLPPIRTWADVQAQIDKGGLTRAELELIDTAKEGRRAKIGTQVPTTKTVDVLIRAPLLRYLILGGCKDCRTDAWGARVQGAWIADQLDLSFAKARGLVGLYDCHIAERPAMLQTKLATLALNQSVLPKGLNTQGAQFDGDVFLRAATSKGEVSLSGAKISGQLTCEEATLRNAGGHALNVQGAQIGGDVFLREASSEGGVHLAGATIRGQLACEGARLRNAGGYALNVQGAQIGGGVFLRNAISEGAVSLSGATISGQLDCVGATLRDAGGHALNAQRAQIGGGVFLRGATSESEVSFSGATVNGQLVFAGATLRNAGGDALNAQRATITAGFFWRDLKEVEGTIDLNSAHVADLVDDQESWRKCDQIFLAGFTYDVLHGTMHVKHRLDWLKMGTDWNGDFHPQPYEHLAKVLRESGHRAEAREILVEKEKAQRLSVRQSWRGERKLRRQLRWMSSGMFEDTAEKPDGIVNETPAISDLAESLFDRFKFFHGPRAYVSYQHYKHADCPDIALVHARQQFRNDQAMAALNLRFKTGLHWAWDKVLRGVVGYGYKPQRSAYVLFALILTGWFMAHQAWYAGDFAPNSDVILESSEWQRLAADRDAYPNPADTWSMSEARGQDYETFEPIYYAVDVVVPIISLGQEAAWAPSTNRGPWGWWLWWMRYWLTTLGWIVTAIGAAAVTGVIRRD